jgi:hypothetical protein
MADISAWSPVDESNTASPPNGWPENMAVSGVNNSARAMMGAVRRFYDTLYSGSFVFSNITCAGNMSVTGIFSGNEVNASNNMNAAGTITGGVVNSNNNISAGGTILGNQVNSNGGMSVAGTLTAGAATVANTITGGTVNSTGTITGGTVNSTGNMNAAGAITGVAVNSTGGMSVAGTLTAGAVVSNNNISAAGTLAAGIANVTNTLTASHVTTNGITVFGTIDAYTVAVSGTVSANLLTANSISSNNNVNAALYNLRSAPFAFMDAAATYTQLSDPGAANITLYANGTNSYQNNEHLFQSRGGFSSYAFFRSTGTYNQSGSWAVISDDRLKRNVEAYTAGLDALLRLTPRSFEYTDAAPWPGRSYGLMASEVTDVVPEMVGEAEFDGVSVQTLMPSHAIFLLINACKELAARVAVLERGVNP